MKLQLHDIHSKIYNKTIVILEQEFKTCDTLVHTALSPGTVTYLDQCIIYFPNQT